MKDDKLLELLKTDPNNGMNQLISQYSGLVFTIVRNKLSDICDSSEIEDCVTDVFLNSRLGLQTFKSKASVKNYLAVIARNTAGMYRRNRVRIDSVDADDFYLELPDDSDFTEELAEEQLLESIHKEIRMLGMPDSVIILRKYYFRQSSKQIAADLKMTVSNVDTRAHRAMEKLRSKFGGKNEKEI